MIDFSTWTRADFQAFDAKRAEVFQQAPEEKAQQEAQILAHQNAKVGAVISALGLARPQVADRKFLSELAVALDLKQYVGENYEAWLDAQVAEIGNPEDCMRHFICRYL